MITKKSSILETYSLIIIDIIAVVVSFALAISIRFAWASRNFFMDDREYLVCALLVLVSILYGVFADYNREFFSRGYFVELIAILKYEIAMLLMFGVIVFLIQAKQFSRLVFIYFAIADFIITYILHITFKKAVLKSYRSSDLADKVLIVSESKRVKDVLKNIKKTDEWNYSITSIALLDQETKPKRSRKIDDIPVVAGEKDLFEVATLLPLDVVFIHVQDYDLKKLRKVIDGFETMGITCHYNVERPELDDLEGKSAGKFAGYSVMTFSLNYRDYRRVLIKRIVDIVGAFVGLILTAVITPFVAVAIKLESKGPVFFAQERVGKNGRRFKIFKFRSMYIDAEERKKQLMEENEMKGLMFKIEDDPRVTKVGKLIRKTSIDELPQFYNVLKGDMSLVGTRPPTVDEFEKYSVYYRRRLSITPGLTGMWQVSGRSDIDDFDEVVKLDLEYIENWSLLLDFKIILQTIGVVLFHKGAK
ncbi:MAG: sugar transferase [Lachnospiraceae bacterium]|nr:sugar transferase [Lachnospiraceae bacterium]